MAESYGIPLVSLKEGRHSFEFEIKEAFFEQFEESEVQEGKLFAHVGIEKHSTLAELTIRIEGVVKICCDRCLEMFFHPVECEDRLIVKFGKSVGDDDPDIISVAVDAPELDLRQQFYEFILLALPIRRIHPDNSRGESTCDPEMMKKLREHLTEEEHNRDPRWDELKKLINDN
jgi:uncharacterized metal-binding protein YceD (DUF177 family)